MLNLGMAIARFRRPALGPSGPDFSTAQVGDAVEGGIYAGTMLDTSGNSYALIISPKSEGEYRSVHGTSGRLADVNAWVSTLTINGYSDWALPDRDEWRILYRAFKPTTSSNITDDGATDRVDPPLGNYTTSNPSQTSVVAFQSGGAEALSSANQYWTSIASNSSYQWIIYLAIGDEQTGLKSGPEEARVVRRVPV